MSFLNARNLISETLDFKIFQKKIIRPTPPPPPRRSNLKVLCIAQRNRWIRAWFITTSIPNKYHRDCVVPITYAQVIGHMVAIRCSFTGEKPIKFEWVFKNMNVSSEQTFLLKEDNMGRYFCRVTFRDGQVINSDSLVTSKYEAEG